MGCSPCPAALIFCVVMWGLGSPSQNGQTCRTLTTKWKWVSAPYDVAASGETGLRAQVYELTTGVNIDLDGTQLAS